MRRFYLAQAVLTSVLLLVASGLVLAQTPPAANGAQAQPQSPLPVTTQIKKTVVFLQTDYLHNFEPQVTSALAAIPTMQPQQVAILKQQIVVVILGLQQVKQVRCEAVSSRD